MISIYTADIASLNFLVSSLYLELPSLQNPWGYGLCSLDFASRRPITPNCSNSIRGYLVRKSKLEGENKE